MNVTECEIVQESEHNFVNEIPKRLTLHRKLDFGIELKSSEPPLVRARYTTISRGIKHFMKNLQPLLEKGALSSSPYGGPVFSVKKRMGTSEWSVSTALSKITMHDSNALRLINEALDED